MTDDYSVELNQIVTHLDLEQFRLFQLFERTPSFQAVADEISRSPNTVRDRMLAASRLFRELFNHDLLINQNGHYLLTHHGHLVAEVSSDLREFLLSRIYEYRSARIPYDVKFTSGLFHFYRALHDEIDENAEFELRPIPARTADLQVYEDSNHGLGTRFSFGSILVSTNQCFKNGKSIESAMHRTVPVSSSVEVQVIRNEPLFLIGPTHLELSGPTTISNVIQQSIPFMVPRGGVAWRFIQENDPLWYERRPALHIEIFYRELGLEMLRNGKRAVMIVHGSRAEFEGEGGIRSWPIKEANGMAHRAVTGLIIDREAPMQEEHFAVIAKLADELFTPGFIEL